MSVSHIHAPRVSVREQAAVLVDRLRRHPSPTFRPLIADCDTTLLVVARFLALLELYREGSVAFDQLDPLGELHVRWTGPADGEVGGRGRGVRRQPRRGAGRREVAAEVTDQDDRGLSGVVPGRTLDDHGPDDQHPSPEADA